MKTWELWTLTVLLVCAWLAAIFIYVVYFAPVEEEKPVIVIDNDTKPLPPPNPPVENETKPTPTPKPPIIIDNETEIIENKSFTHNFSELSPLDN